MIAIGQFFFRFRNAIFPIAMLCALLLATPSYSFDSRAADWLVDLLGIAAIIAGQGVRVLTIGYEYIRRGGRDGRVYADGLVEGGVFAHSRNPLYLGNILMAAGFLLVLGNGALIAVGIALVVFVYAAIVAAEENYLAGRFGDDYDAYRKRVNRWIPDWTGFRESVAEMRFNWERVVAKEYNTTFAVLGGLLLVEAWTHVVENDMTGARLAWTIGGGCALIVAYLLVRVLKKKQILRGA